MWCGGYQSELSRPSLLSTFLAPFRPLVRDLLRAESFLGGIRSDFLY